MPCGVLAYVGVAAAVQDVDLAQAQGLCRLYCGMSGCDNDGLACQVVYGHVAGVLLLHEKETWHGLTGTALIACGAVGANLFKPKAKPSSGRGDTSQVGALLLLDVMHPCPSYKEIPGQGSRVSQLRGPASDPLQEALRAFCPLCS